MEDSVSGGGDEGWGETERETWPRGSLSARISQVRVAGRLPKLRGLSFKILTLCVIILLKGPR